MNINGVQIDATFAEAFPMRATRVIITAHNAKWARIAAEMGPDAPLGTAQVVTA